MITVATADDRQPVVGALVAAFVQDPALRYFFPDDYPRLAAAFFGHLFDKRVGLGTVWTIDAGAASALWDPPAGATDLPPIDLPAAARARLRAYEESVHDALPTEPHWYLGVLGTHPDRAGNGLGRAVMRPGLERAAAEGLPAYLETSTSVNVGIYERAGWRVVAEIPSPVPTWIMTRYNQAQAG